MNLKMRRKLLIIVFLLFVSYAVFANVNFGFKMQAGSPTYTGSGYKNLDAEKGFTVGISAGGFFEFIVNDYFGVQLDIGYSMKIVSYTSETQDSSDKWNMIYIPLYARAKLPTDFAEFYLMAGPSMHFILGEVVFNPVGAEENIAAPDKAFIFGYSLEVGMNLPVMPGGNSLILGLHYNSHFNDPFTTTDLNMNDIDFTIGVCVNSEDMAEQMESY